MEEEDTVQVEELLETTERTIVATTQKLSLGRPSRLPTPQTSLVFGQTRPATALPGSFPTTKGKAQAPPTGIIARPSVTGSSRQARIDEYFTRRPTMGVNRDNTHHECTHCGGVYHSPTQCPVIIAQASNYVPCVKATPIPIPLKPEEDTPTSS